MDIFGGATYNWNNIIFKENTYIKNDAVKSAKEFYKNFTEKGFGAGSSNQKSLIGSISISYWANSDKKESTKVQTFIDAFMGQLKKDFGENIKINIENNNPSGEDKGNTVGASINPKE